MLGLNNAELFNNFLKTAENIITYFDDDKDKRNEVLEQLQGIVEKNCACDAKNKKVSETVKNLLNNVDDNCDPDQVMQSFKEKKNDLIEYNPDVSKLQNFTEYCGQVKELINSADGTTKPVLDDDDIEMTQDDINVIDPFTKRRMTDPVKNKICGHVYERESILSMLKANKNTKCPVVGCISRDAVLKENLIADIVTRKFLQNNPA